MRSGGAAAPPASGLTPVVQCMQLVNDWHTGCEQFVDRADDVGRLHVLAADILLVDEQDSVMGLPSLLPLIVKGPKIIGVLGDQGVAVRGRMSQVNRVVNPSGALPARTVDDVPTLLQP